MNELWPILLAAAVVVIVCLLSRKTRQAAGEYDERQALLRAGAHKHAFYTILILAALHGFLVSVLERPIMEDGVSSMLLIFFRVRQRPGLYLLICAACVLSNLTGAIGSLRSGSLLRNGLLTMQCLPLVVAALFLVVFLTIICKVYLKKEADEE